VAVDLHIHTIASDGSLSPEAVVQTAEQLRLSYIAIADHDSVDGLEIAIKTSKAFHTKVIPAVELSSEYKGKDIHVLGYFINYRNKWFLNHLKILKDIRFNRAKTIVSKLQQVGLDLTMEDVLAQTSCSSIGRTHIARAMVEKGLISSIEEAFTRFLGRGQVGYVEKELYDPEIAIRIIKSIKGIAILAHPGLACIDERIEEFIRYGLDGLEVYHPAHSIEETEYYKELSEQLGLLITGGSDCHGEESIHGLALGTLDIPDSVAEDLINYKKAREREVIV
jgi:hypothetical protein